MTRSETSLLAIFFWIMQPHTVRRGFRSWNSCYFLLNYARVLKRGGRVIVETPNFLLLFSFELCFCYIAGRQQGFQDLAIFFWIMHQNTCSKPSRRGDHASCYFLLNYANQIDWHAYVLHCGESLLFSFELCVSSVTYDPEDDEYSIYACYFLLNYAHLLSNS